MQKQLNSVDVDDVDGCGHHHHHHHRHDNCSLGSLPSDQTTVEFFEDGK